MALYGKRERYDAAQKLIKDGLWVVDPDKGTIASKRFRSLRDMGTVRDDYNRVAVPCPDGKFRYVSAHRVIWESVNGPSDLNLTINHINGNSLDNAYSNLELVTNADNSLHAHRVLGKANQSRNKGSSNPHAKLTEDNVREIKNLQRAGVKGSVISKQFNITQSAVSSIKHGVIWKDVQ